MIFRKLEKNKKNIYRFDNLEIRTNSQEAKNINNNKGIPAKRYSFFRKSTKKNNGKIKETINIFFNYINISVLLYILNV